MIAQLPKASCRTSSSSRARAHSRFFLAATCLLRNLIPTFDLGTDTSAVSQQLYRQRALSEFMAHRHYDGVRAHVGASGHLTHHACTAIPLCAASPTPETVGQLQACSAVQPPGDDKEPRSRRGGLSELPVATLTHRPRRGLFSFTGVKGAVGSTRIRCESLDVRLTLRTRRM